MAMRPEADGLSERRGSGPRCDERPAACARSRRKGRATLPGSSAGVKLGTPARTAAAGPACLLCRWCGERGAGQRGPARACVGSLAGLCAGATGSGRPGTGRVPPPGVGSGPDRDAVAAGAAPADAAGIRNPAQDGAQAVCEVGQQHATTGLEDLSQQVHGAVSLPSITWQTAPRKSSARGKKSQGSRILLQPKASCAGTRALIEFICQVNAVAGWGTGLRSAGGRAAVREWRAGATAHGGKGRQQS